MEDKRPIVYVSRRVGVRGVIIYIVSKAYIIREIKTNNPDGTSYISYNVDYCNPMYENDNIQHRVSEGTKKRIFYNYDDCKKYVGELNQTILKGKLKSFSQNNQEIIDDFNERIKIADEIEKSILNEQENDLNI